MAVITKEPEDGIYSVADTATRCDVRGCGRLIRAGELYLNFPLHKKVACVSCSIGRPPCPRE